MANKKTDLMSSWVANIAAIATLTVVSMAIYVALMWHYVSPPENAKTFVIYYLGEALGASYLFQHLVITVMFLIVAKIVPKWRRTPVARISNSAIFLALPLAILFMQANHYAFCRHVGNSISQCSLF